MLSKQTIIHYLLNLPGWHTRRKLVVIESDDWGSIRMPDKKIREVLDDHPLIDASHGYCKYDTLASAQDLDALFSTLKAVKDMNGRSAVLTANCLVANPDFEKIKRNNFQSYNYESLEKTFDRYKCLNALELWDEGRNEEIFIPQFHGREHLNVPFWLATLREGHEGVRKAFDYGVFGVSFKGIGRGQWNFQRAWDYHGAEDQRFVESALREGITSFQNRFGYGSLTAIAANYTWAPWQEHLLRQHGVLAMQGMSRQRLSQGENIKYEYRYRYTSVNKKKSLAFQQRNAFFEPSIKKSSDHVGECLSRIKIAFQMKKPAIIGSHRVNFIGVHEEKNREENLKMLKYLLQQVIRNWPDAEFMSAAELAKEMVYRHE